MSTTEDGSSGAGGRVQQAPGLWRTDLQQHDLSVPGHEVVQARVDLGPEAPLVKHTHPGEEITQESRPAMRLTEPATMTTPNTDDKKAWESTVPRIRRSPTVVSDTW
jgi:quercetin dioxygenase-like cupin family protein